MADNALLLGAIAIGLGISGAGVTYVIDFERRISIIESRIDVLTGVKLGANMPSGSEEVQEDLSSSKAENTLDPAVIRALAEGCHALIMTYNDIVGSSDNLFSAEKEKLSALQVQMDALGCTSYSANPE